MPWKNNAIWRGNHINLSGLTLNFCTYILYSTCDFGNYYVNPYDTWYGNSPYLRWANEQGFKPIDEWGHYGEDAHQAWAEFLLPYAEKVLNQ